MREIFMQALFTATLMAMAGGTAKATLIDFEAQGISAPSSFTGVLNSPLVIGIATFTGGELLNNTVGGVNMTAVYATSNAQGGPYLDPLTIAFSQPVSGFSIDLTNNFADTYTVADSRGGSQSAAVPFNTTHLFTLAETGITSVTIGSSNTGLFDFAIDNVQFTPASTVPEPSGLLLLASACGAIAALARRKITCD